MHNHLTNLTYKLKMIRNSKGYISDFEILEWNDPDKEIIKDLIDKKESVSYKLLEDQLKFDKTFFQMFASSIEAATFGKFFYVNNNQPDYIFKFEYSNKEDIVEVLLNIDNQISFEDFEEINDIKYFYENIFYSSSDAIFIIEYKNEEFRFVTTNKKHREETGISFNTIHKKTPKELVGEEVGRKLEENYRRALISNDIIAYEEYLELPAGGKYWLTQLKKIEIPKNQKIYIVGSSRDITDLKNKELNNLKLLSELREANAIKNKFFTIIAHDLKNPIYNSQSIGDLLYESLDSLSNKEIKDYLRLLNISLKNSSELLNNLLAWSSSEIKGEKNQPEPVYVKKVIQKLVESFQINIQEKKIKIDINHLDDIIAYCDPNSLYFILRNLLSNAIKFSHVNGKIVISGKLLNSDEVQISIQDEGIGISAREKEKLFSFLSTSKTGTLGEKGSGLGLALVKEFIIKNNGKIHFESQEGKGSVFYVTLPTFNIKKS